MSLPYYKRFPRDFLDGTIGLSLEVKGAYGIVLDLIFMRDGHLEDNAQYIAGQLGCSVRKWLSIKEELFSRGKIECNLGFISNSRADKLLVEAGIYQAKQSENGKKPKKDNGIEKPRLQPETSQTPSHSDTDTEESSLDEVSKHTLSQERAKSFSDFKSVYPQKDGLNAPEVEAAWNAAVDAGSTPQSILAGLTASQKAWAKDNRSYLPKAVKWLSDKGWLDHAPKVENKSLWPGDEKLRNAVKAEKGEGFAASYIDPSGWDGEAILARNDIAMAKLKTVICLRETPIILKAKAAA